MMFDIGLDLFPLLAGVLAAATCGLLGNFLVLRRLSLMGDAMSHSVLPGLVIAFMVTSGRDPFAMFVGAALAGVATVVLIELVKTLGRVEPGAAMGVVFSVLFALGVLLIEQVARSVDLDADCVLYGQLETLAWLEAPTSVAGLLTLDTLRALPRQVVTQIVVFAAAVVLVVSTFKELRIAAFDPGLATTQGVNATVMHYVLMIFVAAATVASFEAVGSILVIAMLVCPAVTARLLTDRLATQLIVSLVAAVAAGTLGYFGSTALPALVGLRNVNAAGSMTVAAGVLLTAAVFFSPTHGLVARMLRRRRLAESSSLDDLLVNLLRHDEVDSSPMDVDDLTARAGLMSPAHSISLASRRGLVESATGGLSLTPAGRRRASRLLRAHRQWERYLVDDAEMPIDHVHAAAERLEHLPLKPDTTASTDPHGRPIPEDLTSRDD